MKTLVAEDDFVSRSVLQEILAPFGQCDVAVNGAEAVDAFRKAIEAGNPYDLVCLDIMMPEMDGQAALKLIREYEATHGITGGDGVKIIMTTALGDFNNIMTAFREQCEAYLLKPIGKDALYKQLRFLGLIQG